MGKVLGKVSGREREWRSPTGKAMSAFEYYEHDAAGAGPEAP